MSMLCRVLRCVCSEKPGGRTPGKPVSSQPTHAGRYAVGLINHYESCSLTAYPDPGTGADPWTIAWGYTGEDVGPGTVWTLPECVVALINRLNVEFVPGVLDAVHVPLNQKQFDALVDIFYNCGVSAMTGSTLVRLLNEGDYQGAADEFPKWDKSGGQVMKGLQRRRWAERLIFLGGETQESIAQAETKYP